MTTTTTCRKRARIDSSQSITNEHTKRSTLTTDVSSKSELSLYSPKVKLSDNAVHQLYSKETVAKIWGIATKSFQQASPPVCYPEYTKPGDLRYVYRDLDFWTSGFFPGSLHLLLARERTYKCTSIHERQLEFACKWWTESLHQNASLDTTHDLGFMVAPWAKIAWELNHDARAFETLKQSAKTLLRRYKSEVGLIRSWDSCVTKRYDFSDARNEFLVVIDNMMNLDLLFYVAQHTQDREMYEAALQHARTTQKTHIRSDSSTIHLVTFDPTTGNVRQRLTNQGYTDTSCWTRGQAWAIAGFAETYHWTHDVSFLETACDCADYFMRRLPVSGVPPWDFDAADDAARDGGHPQPPDVSAAMVAAYGLLLIHKALASLNPCTNYLEQALRLVEAVTGLHMNSPASFVTRSERVDMVERTTANEMFRHVDLGGGETILHGATINNHEYAPRRWADHGLVYADYYFLLVGNTLLNMDIGGVVGHVNLS